MCHRIYADAGKEPPCDECKPVLLEENYPILVLFERYGPAFFGGFGNINTHGVVLAINCEPWVVNKTHTLRKLLRFVSTILDSTKDKNNA